MLSSPHTKEECMMVLDQMASRGQRDLSEWKFGCQTGDHTAYAIVQASNEQEALRLVPDVVRSKARVEKVDQFSPDQIRAFHNM
jgi:hypothetical protein